MEDRNLKYAHVLFLVVSLQFVGYGLAGVLRRYLVWPSGQIWPANMPYIALLRTLHEDQRAVQQKYYGTRESSMWWQLLENRKYFFYFVSSAQFVYCWFPKYIMRVLTNFSWMCMIAPDSLLLSQLTGYRGLGIGSFTFSWESLSSYLGSPLVVPAWAMANIAVGFVLVTWILSPILYFSDVWNCKEQSIAYFSWKHALNNETSAWSALSIATAATGFATPIAVVVHMLLFHGAEFWKLTRTKSIRFKGNDLHCRLMSAYKDVPDWWYASLSLVALSILILISEISHTLQWYNVLLALSIPLVFTLPIGSVLSITGQIIQNSCVYYMCLVIAYALFGDEPVAGNRTLFITIAYTTFCQSLYLVSDMKLAHYMKIAPRILFFVQSLSCLVTSTVSVVFEQYYKNALHTNDTARVGQYAILADFSVVSAFVSSRFFSMDSPYVVFLWIMIACGILPVPFWLARYRWPWCRYVHIPLILIVVSWMPTLPSGALFTWIVVGLLTVTIFSKTYWQRHIYLLSAALSLGLNIMQLIAGAALWNQNIAFPVWWGTGGKNQDGCPLAINRTVGDWFFLSLKTTPD